MNRISRKLIVSGLLTALALPMTAMAASDTKNSAHDSSNRKAGMEKILASWNLSDEQKQQLDELQQQRMESRKQLKDQDFDSRQERHDAMEAQRDEHAAALAEILDENQMKVMHAYWDAAKPMHGKHDGKRDGKAEHQKGDQAKAGDKHMKRGGDERMAMMDALFDSWKLDDSQRDSLKSSFGAMRDDMAALKDTSFDSRDDRKAAVASLRDTQHERLAKVLNDDQIKVLDMMHQRDKRGDKMAEHEQREGMKALIASWNLSDDQEQSLKDIRKDMRQEMHEGMKQARADMKAAKSDDMSKADRKAQHEKQREARLELRKEGREKLANVLSAEQLDALEAYMANGMHHGPKHDQKHGGDHTKPASDKASKA